VCVYVRVDFIGNNNDNLAKSCVWIHVSDCVSVRACVRVCGCV